MADIPPLSQVPLFAGLPLQQLRDISRISREIHFPLGSIVFEESKPADVFYLLLEGKISLSIQLSSSPNQVTVSVITQPLQGFGWSGIVPPHFYTATARCETIVHALGVQGRQLTEILKKDPASGLIVMSRIAEIISKRLRDSRSAFLKSL